MVDVVCGALRQLTFNVKDDFSPRWSPDGRTLAFLSDRDGRTQIYLLSMDGGEASALTSGKNAVREQEEAGTARELDRLWREAFVGVHVAWDQWWTRGGIGIHRPTRAAYSSYDWPNRECSVGSS